MDRMKQLGKLILISLIIFAFFSCKKSIKNNESLKNNETSFNYTIIKNNCITHKELEFFYKKMNVLCNSEKEVSILFHKELKNHYKESFCGLINEAVKNIDGEIEYSVDENCNGIITIISLEKIIDDGEEYRNEYATFLYIKKEKEELKIFNIGGAG